MYARTYTLEDEAPDGRPCQQQRWTLQLCLQDAQGHESYCTSELSALQSCMARHTGGTV